MPKCCIERRVGRSPKGGRAQSQRGWGAAHRSGGPTTFPHCGHGEGRHRQEGREEHSGQDALHACCSTLLGADCTAEGMTRSRAEEIVKFRRVVGSDWLEHIYNV